MPAPVNGMTGVTGERSPASADVVAEARLRQTDRLRVAQAETAKPTEVVESGEKSEGASTSPRREPIQPPYRVNLDDTGRLVTDVLDTETGKIIMRIPPTYVDPDERADAAPAPNASKPENTASTVRDEGLDRSPQREVEA